MPFPMMLERAFREWVTNVLSPPYSRLFPGHEVQSFDQAGYATQLHRPLASTISGPTSQHFLQGERYPVLKVKPLFNFCQEVRQHNTKTAPPLECRLITCDSRPLCLSGDAARHGEDGQVQGDEDPTDHAAHNNHEDGVEGVGQVVRRGVDLGLVERRNFSQHGLQGCLLYTSDAADDLLCVD